MIKRTILFILALFAGQFAFAQSGYEIKVNIKDYKEKELMLAYYLGDKQYIIDTVQQDGRGTFVFKDTEPLDCGVYLIVMEPDNKFFQFVVDQEHQHMSIKTQYDEPIEKMSFKGSKDNQIFYDYLRFLEVKRKKAKELEDKYKDDETKKEEAIAKVTEEVEAYQDKLLKNYPNTMTAKIILASKPVDIPEFAGTEEEQQTKKWRYMQKHYFDNIDLSDPCHLNTPYLFSRVDYFVNKLQVQHPDTIAKAIDYVLEKMKPAANTFKYYVIHFLNEAANSKLVGMDAVYVDMVNNYYAKGLTPWVEQEQLDKIIQNAKDLEPLLIGKQAPDLHLYKRDGSAFNIYDVKADYTILFFWRPDCSHCQKATPFMKDFYEKYHNKNIELIAICTKFRDEIDNCWKYVDEKETGDWIQAIDKYHRSRFMKVYNIKATPQIYILDKNKKIISKKIGAEQLPDVMDSIIEHENEEFLKDN